MLMVWQTTDALVHRAYDADAHDPFIGFPSPTARNPTFIFAHLDFTGVGWKSSDTRRLYTMVSPIHFVGATHAAPGVGQNLRFFTPDNTIRSFVVNSQTTINRSGETDLFIGKLAQAIPASYNIHHHPYLNLPNNNSYLAKPLIMLGTRGKGGSQTSAVFDDITVNGRLSRTITSVYPSSGSDPDECHYEIGDSGGPTMIEENGVAAIIGTHSAYTSTTLLGNTTITNHATFLPHYINELNAVMEPDGYRMAKAIPGSTTLTLNHQVQAGVIRAGHAFTIDLTLGNTGGTLAENLRLTNVFPGGTSATGAGTDWFDQSTVTATEARKAKLASSSNSTYSLSVNMPNEGALQHQVTFSSDQFSASTESFNIEVIGSFLSFASGLVDSTATGDSDLDGISNLLEYAFGGNPSVNSQFFSGTTTPLLPEFANSGGIFRISFIRRKDYVDRAIDYDLESSGAMTNGSWGDASALIVDTNTSSINSEFEIVTHVLSGAANERFFRIKITLSE